MTHTYHVEQQCGSYFVRDEFGHVPSLYNGSMAQFADRNTADLIAAELNAKNDTTHARSAR